MQKKSKKINYYTLTVDGINHQIPVSDICERVGVHPKTVWRWQKGTQRPDKTTLELMKILFAGVIPFPGWEQFRIRDTNRQTYHKRPIYALQLTGSRIELNPSQIQNWSWTAANERDQLTYIKKQLEAVMSERDAIQRRSTVLEMEVQRLRDQLPKAEVIQLKR